MIMRVRERTLHMNLNSCIWKYLNAPIFSKIYNTPK